MFVRSFVLWSVFGRQGRPKEAEGEEGEKKIDRLLPRRSIVRAIIGFIFNYALQRRRSGDAVHLASRVAV